MENFVVNATRGKVTDKMSKIRICTRCVADTTVPNIQFDARGECNLCKIHDDMEKYFPQGEAGHVQLKRLVDKIKAKGRNKQYDCIVGVSGGRDSTYTLYTVVKLGLRPLAVHFDNGWNSEIAVSNIRNATTRLDVDLHTIVADWEEFKDLQLAFLRASVPDAEVPTDVAIVGTRAQVAAEEDIKYVFTGHSFRTEGLMPIGWTYMDGRYIKSVYKRFGKLKKLKTVPNYTLSDLFYYTFVQGIKLIPLLNYVEYKHEKVHRILKDELGWTYYGGHHHESYYTHFFQSFLLPQKFGIDKRKIEYSALVRSGQMDREEALREITEIQYPYEPELVDYTIKKLGLTASQFAEIMALEPKTFRDYPTYYPLIRAMRLPIRLASYFDLLPRHLYLKYST